MMSGSSERSIVGLAVELGLSGFTITAFLCVVVTKEMSPHGGLIQAFPFARCLLDYFLPLPFFVGSTKI
jgi:hypothetical protein